MHAVLADRAEQCLSETAVPTAAHYQEVGAVGGIDQRLRGVALDDAGTYRNAAARVADLADRLGQDLLRVFLEVEACSRAHWSPSVAARRNRVVPGDHRVHSRPGEPGLLGRPAQGAQGRGRAVDPRDD